MKKVKESDKNRFVLSKKDCKIKSIFDVENSKFYSLNETASFIYEKKRDGMTFAEIKIKEPELYNKIDQQVRAQNLLDNQEKLEDYDTPSNRNRHTYAYIMQITGSQMALGVANNTTDKPKRALDDMMTAEDVLLIQKGIDHANELKKTRRL